MPFERLEHEGFVELRFQGRLDSHGWESRSAPAVACASGQRLLLDFSLATTVTVPLHVLVRSAEVAMAQDWRIAVVAPQPGIFGIARQSAQMAGMEEGRRVNVFRERQDAEKWLLLE